MKVSGVEKGSLGQRLGISVGDELMSYDGFPFTDILDYEFIDASERFSLVIQKANGQTVQIPVQKDADDSLGLTFLDDGLSVKTCRNQCMFCFVDQLPDKPDLRGTLFVKDDDYRQSFLYGTYVTLTNISESDLARIKRLRLSPLYISVHSTDENVRKRLLGVKNSVPVLPLIKELSKSGIRLHTQIVYCPGENEDIEQSARALSPYCESLAIVPVGLTAFQNPELRAVTKTDAGRVLETVTRLQNEFLQEKNTRFLWASDEFYLRAQIKIPSAGHYEHYPQIDNGVGLIAKFYEDAEYGIEETKRIYKRRGILKCPVSIATGESAFACVSDIAQRLFREFGAEIRVYKVQNRFFGPSVTVTGLLAGGDLLAQLKGQPLGKRLLLPSVMFRDGSGDFLDNMTLGGLSGALGVPIEKVAADGESFVYAALGRNL